jgi:hypothetical protein
VKAGCKSGPEDGDAVAALLVEVSAERDRLRNGAETSGVFAVPPFFFEGEVFCLNRGGGR